MVYNSKSQKQINDNIAAPYWENTMLQTENLTFFYYDDILIINFLIVYKENVKFYKPVILS